MKLTSFAVLFIMIISPFLLISSIQSRLMNEDHKLRAYYDEVMDNAVTDAAYELSQYGREAPEDSGLTAADVRKIVAATFLDSLYYSFNVYGDTTGMERIKGHVPIILFLENDGYVAYALNEYAGDEGYRVIDYCWYPKRPYSGKVADAGGAMDRYIVQYTLTDTVTVYDRTTDRETTGTYADLAGLIPDFGSQSKFNVLRLSAVSDSVEKDLEYFIGRFNEFSSKIGVTYSFRFPRIEDADWIRAIADESVFAFAQGFPVPNGGTYECNAFGGARVLRKPTIVGYTYTDENNVVRKVYCRDTCESYLEISQQPGFDANGVFYFPDAKDAASNGYFPCEACRP